MTRFASITILAALVASSNGFSVVPTSRPFATSLTATASLDEHPMFFAEEKTHFATVPEADSRQAIEQSTVQEKPEPVKKAAKKPAAGGHKKDGPFAPVVLLAKNVLGDEQLNKVRAKAIGLHSDVIGKFVDTVESRFGESTLRALFTIADKDKNGAIDEEELTRALRALGFSHLKDKQIRGIFARADLDKNGGLDFEEFKKEAPKTLRTNLIKLAKSNGGELGFLV
eukprot:scaffold1034_cov127-Cylindrotheca_fusiformis.AAC.16